MLSAIDATRYGLVHMGRTRRDSFSDRELHALNISMTTRMERDMVVAVLDGVEEKIEQSISGKEVEHWWKWVCAEVSIKLIQEG